MITTPCGKTISKTGCQFTVDSYESHLDHCRDKKCRDEKMKIQKERIDSNGNFSLSDYLHVNQ